MCIRDSDRGMSLLVCCILFYFVSLCVCLYFESLLIAVCNECAPREKKEEEGKNQKQEEEEKPTNRGGKIEPRRVFFFHRPNHCLARLTDNSNKRKTRERKKKERQSCTRTHQNGTGDEDEEKGDEQRKPLWERLRVVLNKEQKIHEEEFSRLEKNRRKKRTQKEKNWRQWMTEDKQIGCSIDRWKSSSLATDSLPLQVLGLDDENVSCLFF